MTARARRRLGLLAAVVVVLAVAGSAALIRSRSGGCTLPAPVATLPDRLRAIGDFDRPYDVSDEQDLLEISARAATALRPDLIGAEAERPVPVAASRPDRHDALVVPLTVSPAPGAPRHLAGMVTLLLDCTGRAYFSAVEDVSTAAPPLSGFPPVTRGEAAVRLGSTDLRLVYGDDPLRPRWRDQRSGRELSAR